mmetsp:Transcript_33934/g.52257  ORF Transcript_33934/g.52257 Transcript_33934/m.52257 type:complete len:81 (+) Transcript_33934:98-340(+)
MGRDVATQETSDLKKDQLFMQKTQEQLDEEELNKKYKPSYGSHDVNTMKASDAAIMSVFHKENLRRHRVQKQAASMKDEY